jgi:hypothetical protein
MKKFNSIDAYIKDEKRQIKQAKKESLKLNDREIRLSKKNADKYKTLNEDETIERLRHLSEKITLGTIKDDELEEYGLRIVGK